MYRIIKIYLFLLFLAVVLSACGEVSPTTSPTALLSATPTTRVLDSPAPGQEVPLPYGSELMLKLTQLSDKPLHSANIILQTLQAHLNGAGSWDLTASTIAGKPVTFTTTYGLVTQGQIGPNGHWAGNLNYPIRNCTLKAECTSTGRFMDHLENRAVWLVDIGGLSIPDAGTGGNVATHAVYGIDDLTLDLYTFGKY